MELRFLLYRLFLQVINEAMKLGIFELLYKEEQPISAERFGKMYKFETDILTRLLNCLTAIKLVSKENKNETSK